ncbi:MAG: FKBP-type peptidyl-prolyl cis-trans isomerase [Bacteroidia bacterium]|nr:FKBP-type peptidyl-prolyl cis-trans isomerase [Bacteroidia bacterium]
MKRMLSIGLMLLVATMAVQAQSLKTKQDSISYMLGADLAKNLSSQGMVLSADFVSQGMADIFEGKESLFNEATSQELMTAFQNEMRGAQMKKAQEAAAENVAAGEAFLAENAQKEGVKTTESGLQYEVITEGTGAKPLATNVVEVHYEGRLLDGTIFDSSYQRGQPATFPLNRVIAGWTEGLQLMPVGSKYRLYIPSSLGYGPQGSPPTIGPGATLVFDVELISIQQ